MSCGYCEYARIMNGHVDYPGEADVGCCIIKFDGNPKLTTTSLLTLEPGSEEYNSEGAFRTIYKGWVPVNYCPWCGARLVNENKPVEVWQQASADDVTCYEVEQ